MSPSAIFTSTSAVSYLPSGNEWTMEQTTVTILTAITATDRIPQARADLTKSQFVRIALPRTLLMANINIK